MCVTRNLKCIIVAPGETFKASTERLLHSYNKGYTEFSAVPTISSAVEKLKSESFNLLVIEIDEVDYDELDKLIKHDPKDCAVIIIINKDRYLDVFKKTYSLGFLLIPRPVTVNTFLQALQIGLNGSDKIKNDFNNTKKITDIRYLDIAKMLLVLHEKMSEEEAHRYVEKLSMDLRVCKLKSAEYVINRYVKI